VEHVDDELADRIAGAWELRATGKSVRSVAKAFGISVSTCHGWLVRAEQAADYAGLSDAPAERRRDMTSVDTWLARVDGAYVAGDLPVDKAVAAVVSLLGVRGKRLGLDAPSRVALAVDKPEARPDPAVADAIKRVIERNAADSDRLRQGGADDGV
jgi:hypothetical protein